MCMLCIYLRVEADGWTEGGMARETTDRIGSYPIREDFLRYLASQIRYDTPTD
jgi:hypothetical protein